MRKNIFPAALLVASTIAGLAAAATSDTPTKDRRLAMSAAFEAPGPHSSLGIEATVFARLVGSWDVKYTDTTKAGKTLHRTGALHFGWVMDGRVLQNFWVVDPWGTIKEREVYTDLFFFEPKSATWHIASVDPYVASVATFIGGPVGDDRIVMESHDLDPKETHRWSYNDIRPSSVVFRDEVSSDGGKTWTLKSEYNMTRRLHVNLF